jgi:hypothetical protein
MNFLLDRRFQVRREFWTFKGAPLPESRVKHPQIEGLG